MSRLLWMSVALWFGAGAAQAEDAERPWAAGVPAADQARALELFGEGNRLFEESRHAEALAKYREAIASWDHPAIRYNSAVALIHLDQPLAAYQNLERSLRYDAAPFDKETYGQALTYRKLLLGQLAELKVVCTEPEAEVALDGERLFKAPGEAKRRLLPGAHQLVAAKPGHLTDSRALLLLPGKLVEETLTPRPIPTMTARRRWSSWKPWLITAAGALVAIAGVPLVVEAKASNDEFDRGVRSQCPAGCPTASLPASLKADRDRGALETGLGAASFAAGGALMVGGIVMVILNQPRVVERPLGGLMTIAPSVGPGLSGVTLWYRF